ncbi:glycogen synthase GlgA [Lichenifustis flavocetrariae]|uniref:Glycogen synthase n=1 Tax=Lichenifustis flavocetrariae TaxID=2949735 RepID=A0AA42CLS3_9HYPH|nr:glycogen synthase GlgA [Lichenifustis flavocetrariae]MCW6507682.1 glycogen synthase GlgA [Lichenifustis flavocetrariae]
MSLQVLSVASEVYPLIKTGGLADVAGALPGALAAEQVHVRTLLPGYPAVMTALGPHVEALHRWDNLFGGEARLIAGQAAGLDLLAIDAPHLFAREGNPYLASNGTDWPDNAFRFAALGRAAAEIGRGLVPGVTVQVVHAHDWQAGLTLAYLHYGDAPRPGSVFTIHNMAFPGQFPAGLLGALGLPGQAMTVEGIEYFNTISFLKAGLKFADRITTVSPTYAAEIQTPQNGMGFDGLLRARHNVLSGIRNGIDNLAWNPAQDLYIPARYDASDISPRAENKLALQSRLGLKQDPDALLFGVVSRLSDQKGLDLLLTAIPTLIELGGQLAVLGSGSKWYEDGFRNAKAFHPGLIGVQLGYDEGLAHLIQAGCDALLVPSRFEPCGLTQLCALRYGAVPVVARVGGLADTIVDANEMALASGAATGIQFAPVTLDGLQYALRRTADIFRDKDDWVGMIKAGMSTDVSWRRPARTLARLYRDLAGA